MAEACNFIKKETLAQVFSCGFCEISKNTFFHRTPLVAAKIENTKIENATFPYKTALSEPTVKTNRIEYKMDLPSRQLPVQS